MLSNPLNLALLSPASRLPHGFDYDTLPRDL